MIWLDVITDNLPGPTRLRVRGQSMLPTLRPGDEVVVHPVTAEALAPGDWVALRGGFLHRYLGRRHGRVVTKGDGHRALDPAWPPDAVLGRVVEAQRDGRCFYRRTPGQLRRERLLAAGHHALGDVWGVLRRVKALLLALFALALAASLAWAAVTLTSFTAGASTDCEDGTDCIILEWKTESETNNLGYRLWRSLDDDDYVDISGFIASLDDGVGAAYVFTDTDVIPSITYYYKLQDLPADGNQNSYTDPISATIPTTPTLTPTPTATPTSTPTPNPNVRFWTDKADLTAGECTTLYWQTNNIMAVYFDGADVAGDGERAFCPCATEPHTLRVKYISGATEDFEIELTVTGECGAVTPTLTPQATTAAFATATPRPTSTPAASTTQAVTTAASTLTAAPTTAPGVEVQITATQPAPPFATDPVPPLATDPLLAAPLSTPVTSMPDSTPTRGPVEGESSGVPVEKMLSIWLLLVGGIVGAGFVGAGILTWKRQQ